MIINIFGADNFDYEIIDNCSQEELNEKEQYYIQKYNSIENGYNYQFGGYNNSIGSGNGRAIMTEQEIEEIRRAYNNHEQPTKIYEKYKDKITKNSFQMIWQGRTWKNIMPEVYTKENKDYYKRGINFTKATISAEDLLKYRKYYVNHTRNEVLDYYLQDCKEKNIITPLFNTSFFKILTGDVRKNSSYKKVPLYKKSQKKWVNE